MNDILWKGMLEDIFEPFLRFFYPNADELFDFSKGFEFLNQELVQLFGEDKNKRYVDKAGEGIHQRWRGRVGSRSC